MLHEYAVKVSRFLVKKNTRKQRFDLRVYYVELILSQLPFWLFVFIWMKCTDRYVETISLIAPFYLIRRRMGGWHAKTPFSCFLISIAIVIAGTYLGQALSSATEPLIITIDGLLLIVLFIVKPEYPPQVDYSKAEVDKNNGMRRCLLIAIFFLQLGASITGDNIILPYTLLSLALAAVSLLLLKIASVCRV